MTAYVLRFCNNIKRNPPKLVNSLSREEIQKAEETLTKIMQSEWPSEIREKYKDTDTVFRGKWHPESSNKTDSQPRSRGLYASYSFARPSSSRKTGFVYS
ncbi:integrase catalytic domain-containing protein [Trichonephila clavipes]|nr:integrase catalytic domain-containing protein [Trichonephila clavipes]